MILKVSTATGTVRAVARLS